jgi:hypothetical protein
MNAQQCFLKSWSFVVILTFILFLTNAAFDLFVSIKLSLCSTARDLNHPVVARIIPSNANYDCPQLCASGFVAVRNKNTCQCLITIANTNGNLFPICSTIWEQWVGYWSSRPISCHNNHFVSTQRDGKYFCLIFIHHANVSETPPVRHIFPHCSSENNSLVIGYGIRKSDSPVECAPENKQFIDFCVTPHPSIIQSHQNLQSVIKSVSERNTVFFASGSFTYRRSLIAWSKSMLERHGVKNAVIVCYDEPCHYYVLSQGYRSVYLPHPKPMEWCMRRFRIPGWRGSNFAKMGVLKQITCDLRMNAVMMDIDAGFHVLPDFYSMSADVVWSPLQEPLSLEVVFVRANEKTCNFVQTVLSNTLNFGWDQDEFGHAIFAQKLVSGHAFPGGTVWGSSGGEHAKILNNRGKSITQQFLEIEAPIPSGRQWPDIVKQFAVFLCASHQLNRVLVLPDQFLSILDVQMLSLVWNVSAQKPPTGAALKYKISDLPNNCPGVSDQLQLLQSFLHPPLPKRPAYKCLRKAGLSDFPLCSRYCQKREECLPNDEIIFRC